MVEAAASAEEAAEAAGSATAATEAVAPAAEATVAAEEATAAAAPGRRELIRKRMITAGGIRGVIIPHPTDISF